MATYTRQSSFSDGDSITAALFNDEFNQLVNTFHVSTGHSHDGTTAGDGGPITVLYGNSLTFGTNAESDVVITFNAASNDGVLSWMEDEDYFKFSDDVYIDSDLTVTGNAVINGNLTFGNAATDTVSFGADIDSHIIPDDDDTYDLGSSTQQWRNAYIDGTLEADAITIGGATLAETIS